MATLVDTSTSTSKIRHLRPVDNVRDLAKIADLIELCFGETLDPDGRNYLNQMRASSASQPVATLAAFFTWQAPFIPVSGYVWEEEGKVVGNLSLIPIRVSGKRSCLIANVAVHPDHRGQGIAQSLTRAAISYVRRRGLPSCWLQVRQDSPAALHIYQKMGFLERTRRTAWYSSNKAPKEQAWPGYEVIPRHPKHWPQQRAWLERVYPPLYRWHLSLNLHAFHPGIWGTLYRFFMINTVRHWSIVRKGRLLGILSWQHSYGDYANPLWLAVPANVEPQAVQALLSSVRHNWGGQKRLLLNTPAQLTPDAIRESGFSEQQTLIWMEHRSS